MRKSTPASTSIPDGFSPRIRGPAELAEVLERLPDQPGVYIMRDRQGAVVYVGKARRLRVRVKQYFSGHDTRFFVPLLEQIVGDIETIVTSNDKESLLLENNLIKQYLPRFNVRLRDDKNYLLLRLDPLARWPRLELVRKTRQDGAAYFGPYHSASSARQTLRLVNRHFQLRTCTDYVLDHRRRPCLQHQIGRCPAPCVYAVDNAQYGEQVRDVGLFLAGRHKELLVGVGERMRQAAEALEFEKAARARDQLHALETTLTAQQIVSADAVEQDAIGMYREGGQVDFVVLQIREGKVLGTQSFSQSGMELPDPEVLANFVRAYYDAAPFVPEEVLLPYALADDDAEPMAAWLKELRGRRAALLVPVRGSRKTVVTMACKNASSNFSTRRNHQRDADHALGRLQARLGLSKLPRTIECYDISHIQGTDVVASMVVFTDGVADKARYRMFKIRGDKPGSVMHNDDFASMYEVLSRRFKRAVQPKHEDDAWTLPDLIIIDGGKGQLGRALAAIQDFGIPLGAEGVDVVALAKERRSGLGSGQREKLQRLRAHKSTRDGSMVAADGHAPSVETTEPTQIATSAETTPALAVEGDASSLDVPTIPGKTYQDWEVAHADEVVDPDAFDVRPERVFVPRAKDAIALKPGSSERHLMERIRDEAHRFAISHHRKRRSKRTLRSAIDEIAGVGPSLRRALLRHFGSVAALRSATTEQLQEVKGVGKALATKIHREVGSR